MRWGSIVSAAIVTFAACGGTTTSNDGGVDAASQDVSTVDAAECVPPGATCATPCPAGTYCLKTSGPTVGDLGCTPIPPECGGVPSCACMTNCFCTGSPVDKCTAGADYLMCDNGLKSRREFKTDISYVDDAERVTLAARAREMPLHAERSEMQLYGDMSTLVAAVQEQQKEIEALRAEIAALTARRTPTRDAPSARPK